MTTYTHSYRRIIALLSKPSDQVHGSNHRGIPMYTTFSIQSAAAEAQFDTNLHQWISDSSRIIFQPPSTTQLFSPRLQSIAQTNSSKVKVAWQDTCLNYGLLCKDLSDLITISRTAAETDALENPNLPESFTIRTRLLGTTQAFVLRNRAIWDKIMNLMVLSSENPAAIKIWEGKEKSAKKKFEKAQQVIPDHIPEWFPKTILGGKSDRWEGGIIELFDNMLRTPEVHHSGTLRKWALAQTIQVRTIDLIHAFFRLTESTIQQLQSALEGKPQWNTARPIYFEHAIDLLLRIEDHDDYVTKQRGNFKAIAHELASNNQDRLDLFWIEIQWAFPQFQYADTPELKWRDALGKTNEQLTHFPENTTLLRFKYRLMDSRRNELSLPELVDLSRHHRDTGHSHYTETKTRQRDTFFEAVTADISIMDAAHLYDFGLRMKDEGHLDKAIDAYTLLNEKYPHKHRALVGKSICLAQAGRISEASQTLDRLDTTGSTNINARYVRSIVATHSEQYSLAMEHTASVLEEDPNWAAAWSLVGLIALKQKKYDLATTAFSKAIELAPQHIEAIFNLGYTHLENGNDAAAKLAFMDVLKQNPNDHEAALHLAQILVRENPIANRDDIVHWAVVAHRGGPQYDKARLILDNIFRNTPQTDQFPQWETAISNPHLTHLAETVDQLGHHQFYREALQLWTDIANTIDLTLGSSHARLVRDATLLYWLIKKECYNSEEQTYPADKCDTAESAFNGLLKDVLAPSITDPTFDKSLVGNIWSQLAKISESRAIYADNPHDQISHLTKAHKYAVNSNKTAPSALKEDYINLLSGCLNHH